MRCNFLAGKYMLACKAGRHSYVPSSFEIEEYCKTGRHGICPFYPSSTAENAGDFVKPDRYPSGLLPGREKTGATGPTVG